MMRLERHAALCECFQELRRQLCEVLWLWHHRLARFRAVSPQLAAFRDALRDAPADTDWDETYPCHWDAESCIICSRLQCSWREFYLNMRRWFCRQIRKFRQYVEETDDILAEMRRVSWRCRKECVPDQDEFIHLSDQEGMCF